MCCVLMVEGGRLGLVWNVCDELLDWVVEIICIIIFYEGDVLCFYKGDWCWLFECVFFGLLCLFIFVYEYVGLLEQVIVLCFFLVSFIVVLLEMEKNVVVV